MPWLVVIGWRVSACDGGLINGLYQRHDHKSSEHLTSLATLHSKEHGDVSGACSVTALELVVLLKRKVGHYQDSPGIDTKVVLHEFDWQ